MNCCNGDCTQGPDCPARTGKVSAHRLQPRTCDELGVCQGRGDCACTHPVPSEAGNFRIIDLDPDDYDYTSCQLLNYDETMALVRTLLLWLLAATCTVAVVSMAVGYGTERFSDVLWAYLAGVS